MFTLTSHFRKYSNKIPDAYISKAFSINEMLSNNIPFHQIGGKRIKQSPQYIRFRLGLHWRLIFRQSRLGFQPITIIPRENFETFINKKR